MAQLFALLRSFLCLFNLLLAIVIHIDNVSYFVECFVEYWFVAVYGNFIPWAAKDVEVLLWIVGH